MQEPFKPCLLICLLIFCSIAAQAQTKATTEDGKRVVLNADGTWKYAENSSGVTLKVEAGIVYSDGPQPVARTAFALLDADPSPEFVKLPPSQFARNNKLNVNNAGEELLVMCGSSMPEAMSVIGRHTLYTTTTGFDGRGEFIGIKPGKYWLFGGTKIRKTWGRGECAFWLLAIDVTKDQNIVLDQNNAIIGKPMTFR